MENTPLSSIKVSDETFQKLQKAADLSGLQIADVRRLALDIGLASLEKIGFQVKPFTVNAIIEATERTATPQAKPQASDRERKPDPTDQRGREPVKKPIRHSSRSRS